MRGSKQVTQNSTNLAVFLFCFISTFSDNYFKLMLLNKMDLYIMGRKINKSNQNFKMAVIMKTASKIGCAKIHTGNETFLIQYDAKRSIFN